MELAVLAGTDVARHSDVSEARERARRRRLRRVAVVLFLVLAVLVVRDVGLFAHRVAGTHTRVPAVLGSQGGIGSYLPALVLIGVLLAVLVMPMLAVGRSPHILYRPEELDVRLADVVGAATVVDEVVKTLNLFLNHQTFRREMGGSARRGILFEGPPGTGKTYIAKALAAEAGVPFLFVSSSAFQSMYYGATNRKIRAYFRALRRYARDSGGAIGFIEEIDAIGAARTGMGGGGREGISGVVNELLIQLQSFDQPTAAGRMWGWLAEAVNAYLPPALTIKKPKVEPANILVIGATNRAGDLDPALLRPGRFDRTISVDLPSRAGRREIVDFYMDRKAHAAELDGPSRRETLAAMTFGYSPVMLERLLDEALVMALRRGDNRLDWDDIQRAKMTTELGLTQPVALSETERRMVATHEAGHATVAWALTPHRKLEVLSIIKRRTSLGLLAHSDSEERWTTTQTEAEHLIRIAFGGMVAEELFFAETSSGVAGDLKAATEIAARMVGSWGMGGGLASFEAASGAGTVVHRVLADDGAAAEVERILEGARTDVRSLLSSRPELVAALRDALLEREELIGDEIAEVLEAASFHAAVTEDAASDLVPDAAAGAGEDPPGQAAVIDLRIVRDGENDSAAWRRPLSPPRER